LIFQLSEVKPFGAGYGRKPVTTQHEIAGYSQSKRTMQVSTAVADPPRSPGRSLSPIKSKSLTIIR